MLRLELLGGFRVTGTDKEPLTIPGIKTRALLAYLACMGPQPRATLMALFWGERFDNQARQSLRKALWTLRRALGEAAETIVPQDDKVALEAGAWGCDVLRFKELVPRGTPEALQEAVDLYRGEFLAGLTVGEDDFERWLEEERALLRNLAADALVGLAQGELERGGVPAAVELARRAAALEPLREDAQRVLMRALAASGHRVEALRRYRDLEALLQRELGSRPEAETRRVLKAIQAGADVDSPSAESSADKAAGSEDEVGRKRVDAPDGASSLPLPDKPSIAVLPFVNLSSDPEQEYFSDGITDDIITGLARFHSLFVIARHSSFVYKGQSVDVRDIGRELGVQYVAEGRVRRAGNRVRVNAQLIEAETGRNLWGERYDREFDDIFEAQDEVTQAIVGALPGRLGEAAVERARRKPTESLTAYDYYLRGEGYLRLDNAHADARRLYEKAVETDPQCARAFARLAAHHALFSRGERTEDDVLKAQRYAERALAIDDGDPFILGVAAVAYLLVGDHDRARRHIQTAISLNPNDAQVIYYAVFILSYLGDHAEAQQWLQKALRFGPHFWEPYQEILVDAYYMNRQYMRAIETMKEWRNPHPVTRAALAASWAQLGRMSEAKAAVDKFNRTIPDGYDFTAVAAAHARICKRKEEADHWLEGYRKAGLLV